ncbi:MAG: DUF2807 domain-containing protein [Deltaproteobacteria bacterium]|nr:DUF2807 domain-containing protein [Deltaproteobacteria bacterium]
MKIMMNNRLGGVPAIVWFSISILIVSCSHAVGSGIRSQETRTVAPFEQIIVSGKMNITLQVGANYEVLLSGDDNVVDAVKVRVINNALRIQAPKASIQKQQLQVTIVTPRLTGITASLTENISINMSGSPVDELRIRLSGVGRLDINGVQAQSIQSQMDGTGKLTIEGRANHLNFRISGLGQGNFSHLCLRTASIRVNGMGKVTINAAENLEATVKGLGKVAYFGDPSLQRDVTGGGKIEPIENTAPSSCGDAQQL